MAEQPQGTEYTLQGVMRFLQMEWHNHERARNAWDIERAEMRAKIAKQEGETRSAKRLNESLDRQIRMLERALKAERAKTKALKSGATAADAEQAHKDTEVDAKSDPKGPPKLQELLRSSNLDFKTPLEPEHEARADRAKDYSQKSVEELTYLLSPPSFPPPPEPLAPGSAIYSHDPRMAEEVYAEVQRRDQQLANMSHLPSLPNHHPPPVRMPPEYHNTPMQSESSPTSLDVPVIMDERSMSGAQTAPIQARGVDPNASPQEEIEQISYTVNASDQEVAQRDASNKLQHSSIVRDESDDWNFDESNLVPQPQPEVAQPRRLDAEAFPSPNNAPMRSPPPPHRRKSSGSLGMIRRRSAEAHEVRSTKQELPTFKVRFALRGHLDVVRSVIFTGGGSPSEPEICTTGDDGMVKRWIIPSSYAHVPASQQHSPPDLDIQSYFTHRGHEGMVTCLAASPASASFSTGGRALGDGWVFSGGQDATILVWERGRVDPKARLEGHTDAIWALCVLPAPASSVFGQNPNIPVGERILLVSGSADKTIKIWAVSSPPQLSSPQNAPSGGRRGVGGTRRHSLSSGSNFPSSPQPSTASVTPFHYTLIHSIDLPVHSTASPTSIAPLGNDGENFVVAYSDSSVLIFNTRTGDEVVSMQSSESYDGTSATGINAVVASSGGAEHGTGDLSNEDVPTGREGGVEGVVISGHEDRFVRFFDANSGQCTYSMLAHPSSIASLSLSPDGRELVSAGHDASLRFWSLETRSCTQEITSHRLMRGEGVVSVVWSQDGRWVVSGGGDGVVKVFSR